MRPAQKAPENTEIMLNSLERDINFNEAGAKSAGKRTMSLATAKKWKELQ